MQRRSPCMSLVINIPENWLSSTFIFVHIIMQNDPSGWGISILSWVDWLVDWVLHVQRYAPYVSTCRFARKTMTVRDTCPVLQKTMSPNLQELLTQRGKVCLTGPSQGTRDIYSLLGRKFTAVWTFTVPAKQCFEIQFLIRMQRGRSDYYTHCDRLTILDGELSHPVMLKSGMSQFDFPPQNDTATVSVVYFYTSLSGRVVYWKMAPSLKASDCFCWLVCS